MKHTIIDGIMFLTQKDKFPTKKRRREHASFFTQNALRNACAFACDQGRCGLGTALLALRHFVPEIIVPGVRRVVVHPDDFGARGGGNVSTKTPQNFVEFLST